MKRLRSAAPDGGVQADRITKGRPRKRAAGLVAGLAAGALLLPVGAAYAAESSGFTELVSADSNEAPGDGISESASVSADGRYVAFASGSGNLVAEDTNGDTFNSASDIFVRDRMTGTTERVSVSDNGHEADGDSLSPSISADGRYVAFSSGATNLVNGDKNGVADIFVRDRQEGTTTRVSISSAGDEGLGDSAEPSISADGRYVAFNSTADNLVPSDTSFWTDIFVHDLQTGLTERISEAPDGSDANNHSSFRPQISEDGTFVHYSSSASNLVPGVETDSDVDAFLHNRSTGTTTAVTAAKGDPDFQATVNAYAHGMSDNGRYLTFTTPDDQFITPDTNGFSEDAWLYDRVDDDYTLLSVNDAGEQGDALTFAGDVSNDGRYVAMISRATNFGGPENFRENIYQRDVEAGTTTLVSVASDGTFGNLFSLAPSMTPDGQVIAFDSASSNFFPNDDNTAKDVFVHDMRPAADLAVTMTDSADPATARQELTYTVTVTNNGSATASGISLEDVLPDEELVSVTTSKGSCIEVKEQGDVSLSCDLGSLADGETATVTIVIIPARDGTITNATEVRADQPDSDAANNKAAETTTVAPWE